MLPTRCLRTVLRSATIVSVALLVSGCAFGTRHVTLLPVKPETASKLAQPASIVVLPVIDKRDDPSIGCVRNGFYMRTAEVVADNSVADWVTQSLSESLADSGFSVKTAKASDSDLVLQGELLKLFCNSYMSIKGRATLSVKITKGSQTILEKTYEGTRSRLNWVAASGEFRGAARNALQAVMEEAVPEICTAAGKAGP